MVVIAALLIIALIGLFVAIGFIIAVVLSFRKLPNRIVTMVEPSKNSSVELYNTGKGIYEVGKIRCKGYAKQGTRIAAAIKTTSDQVKTAAQSVDVKGAKSTLRQAAATLNAAQESLAAVRAIIDILGRSQHE